MAISLYTVLVLAVFAASLDNCSALTDEKKAEIKEKLKVHINECGADYGITPDVLKEFKEQKKQPDDTNKCFFACMFKKIGLMDSQGLFSEEVAIQKLSQYAEESKLEKAKAAAKACTSVNQEAVSDGEAGCDRAKLLFTCIMEQKELYGFAV
uniref:Odorant Binding Protein n=1 Tax=Epiphyas postvittana TaxID=65032 RepID=A0A0K8TU95_EPIPO